MWLDQTRNYDFPSLKVCWLPIQINSSIYWSFINYFNAWHFLEILLLFDLTTNIINPNHLTLILFTELIPVFVQQNTTYNFFLNISFTLLPEFISNWQVLSIFKSKVICTRTQKTLGKRRQIENNNGQFTSYIETFLTIGYTWLTWLYLLYTV